MNTALNTALNTGMNAYPTAIPYAPRLAEKMAKVAAPGGPFGPAKTAAQAQADAMTPAQRDAAKAKIHATAKDFEAQFIASMMGQTFEHVDLGGGEGADQFKTIMMQAMGKKIAAGKGIGLARQVETEMLKLQGLS